MFPVFLLQILGKIVTEFIYLFSAVEQMVSSLGPYPEGRRFESCPRYENSFQTSKKGAYKRMDWNLLAASNRVSL